MADGIVVVGRRQSLNVTASTFQIATGHNWTPRMLPEDQQGYTVWQNDYLVRRATLQEAVALILENPGYPNVEIGYVIEKRADGIYEIVGPYTSNNTATANLVVPQNAVAYIHNHPVNGDVNSIYPGTNITYGEALKAPSASWQNGPDSNVAMDWDDYDRLVGLRNGAYLLLVVVGPDGVGRGYDKNSPRTPGYVSPNIAPSG